MSVRGAEWIDDIESRENSLDGHEGSSDKRTSKKRKVLSCYACRNRKMKCDRVYPICGRCQKTGRADQCTYDPRLLEESHVNTGTHTVDGDPSFRSQRHDTADQVSAHMSSDALRYKVRAQERRIEMLEQKLAVKTGNLTHSRYQDVLPEEPEIEEEMMFRGKGFKTQFHGVTSIMSIIGRNRELQIFTREALTVDHSIMHVKIDFKAFRGRRKVATRELGARTHGADEEIFAALPDKSVIDVQAAIYFQNCETTYRILHEPSFWKDYHNFWEQSPNNNDRVGFAVVLVLIFTITKCLSPKDDIFIGDTTADRQAASDLIDICEAWNARQPRKRLTLLFFQLQCLLLLAKRVNCVKLKQDWVSSGDLIRLALASGMHRDPSLLVSGRISEFEKEMKKRLWVTIMELELLSSFENGHQSTLTGLYFDTPAPSNLPDDAFSIETQEMPASRPVDHFTTASYLIAALESLPLRIHLTQLLNTPSSELQYADVMHYDAQIQSAISSLPRWGGDRATIPSALLELQLRQYLLVLHKPYAKCASKQNRYMYSFTTIVDTASSIISLHHDLVEKGILVLNSSRNDVVRVGLTLSPILYENCTRHGPIKSSAPPPTHKNDKFANSNNHFADMPSASNMAVPDTSLYLATIPQAPFLAKTLCTTSVEILDRARQIYEQKVMRLGTGYMEFWLISAAVGMLPAPASPATSIAYVTNASDDILVRCRRALDYFTTLAFRVLALQRDPENSFAKSLRTTMASVSPDDGGAELHGDGLGLELTPRQTGRASFSMIPGAANGGGNSNNTSSTNEAGGPFDALQDMQVDLSGWSFPDFWAFDLGGDF